MTISASLLMNLLRCPHRVTQDLKGDRAKREEPNAFVQLLWERGTSFEKETLAAIGEPFADLSGFTEAEKEQRTVDAMRTRESLIYGGRIRHGDLVGLPDLLRREGGGYVPIDIKAGAGEVGGDDGNPGKLKRDYGVQLALYADILERHGRSAGRRGYIWDVHGEEVEYDLNQSAGGRRAASLWDVYQEALVQARAIVAGHATTTPALASVCKLCVWRSACREQIDARDDLTLIPELGRSRRDALVHRFRTVADLAAADLSLHIRGEKTSFKGVGPETLRTFQARARLLTQAGAKPYLKGPVRLPVMKRELFYDVETDPLRDLCYLHGFVERVNGAERYISIFVDDPADAAAEGRAFADAMTLLRAEDAAIYVYSAYERTTLKALARKFPQVASEAEVEATLGGPRAVDLYLDVVRPATEWPTNDFSIKTLAKYLGFKWRDTNPSGAASIEWFHQWTGSADPAVKQRILDYNEDDCRAMRVVLDAVRRITEV